MPEKLVGLWKKENSGGIQRGIYPPLSAAKIMIHKIADHCYVSVIILAD
jgi:hypothetical protein